MIPFLFVYQLFKSCMFICTVIPELVGHVQGDLQVSNSITKSTCTGQDLIAEMQV